MDRTIEIADDLVKAAQDASGEVDERAAVEKVLRSVLAPKSPTKSMFDLVGKINIRDDYDYKSLRAGDAGTD